MDPRTETDFSVACPTCQARRSLDDVTLVARPQRSVYCCPDDASPLVNVFVKTDGDLGFRALVTVDIHLG